MPLLGLYWAFIEPFINRYSTIIIEEKLFLYFIKEVIVSIIGGGHLGVVRTVYYIDCM